MGTHSCSRTVGSLLCIAVLATLSEHSAVAQHFVGDLVILGGLPQGEFKHNVSGSAYGLAVTFGYAPASTPVMAGVKVGFLTYGNEDRTEPFSTTIPDVRVNVSTSNNLLLAHGVLRFQPTQGALQPYIQGLVGLSYFFTETKIENSPGMEVASTTNLSDAVFSYGAGGGVMVHVSGDPESEAIKEWLIDIGASYIRGGQAEYLKEGSIRRDGGTVTFDTIRSRTDLVMIHAGVAVRF